MKRIAMIVASLGMIALGVVSAQKHKLAAEAAAGATSVGESQTQRTGDAPSKTGVPIEERVINPAQTTSVDESLIAPEQFQTIAQEVLAGLPKRAEIRKLTDAEVHSAPTHVVRAGTLLGRVAQALHDNPSLARMGAEFYRKCTSDDGFVTSVRALCYSRLKARDPMASIDVPANVRLLAQQIVN